MLAIDIVAARVVRIAADGPVLQPRSARSHHGHTHRTREHAPAAPRSSGGSTQRASAAAAASYHLAPPAAPVVPASSFDWAMRTQLGQDINTLGQEDLSRLVQLLSAEVSSADGGEVELDLETMTDPTLYRLRAFVDNCLRAGPPPPPVYQPAPYYDPSVYGHPSGPYGDSGYGDSAATDAESAASYEASAMRFAEAAMPDTDDISTEGQADAPREDSSNNSLAHQPPHQAFNQHPQTQLSSEVVPAQATHPEPPLAPDVPL
eukprot:TRINITY_DN9660_c2_g1_i1.p1 TRINITY_DN9660_c2_g1~~TRINITY_DN9660_c2_g1_i1.p1  ORF type:complete len:262 (-),score=66.14 TRINITY_DN9660_c2_g1_i1:345-1130(-)